MADTFETVLDALNEHRRIQSSQARFLSGLADSQISRLQPVWLRMTAAERMNLLAMLRRNSEEDNLVDFAAVCEMAMLDSDSDVRRVAVVASGATESERLSLMERLLSLASADPDEMVRGAAADRLGEFAYEAEVGKLSEAHARRIEGVLLERASSETESNSVRAAALASVGYISSDAVRAELRRAITRSGLRLAAIKAMDRNSDPVWLPYIVEQMGSEDPEVRRQAAEAAAGFEEAAGSLADLVDDPDRAVRLTAIDSLGKIGTDEAREVLVYCFESSDPEIKEAATRAMQQAEEEDDPMGTAGIKWEDE